MCTSDFTFPSSTVAWHGWVGSWVSVAGRTRTDNRESAPATARHTTRGQRITMWVTGVGKVMILRSFSFYGPGITYCCLAFAILLSFRRWPDVSSLVGFHRKGGRIKGKSTFFTPLVTAAAWCWFGTPLNGLFYFLLNVHCHHVLVSLVERFSILSSLSYFLSSPKNTLSLVTTVHTRLHSVAVGFTGRMS